jgi:hypothetical protein
LKRVEATIPFFKRTGQIIRTMIRGMNYRTEKTTMNCAASYKGDYVKKKMIG